jgi:hypothetical protein
MPVNGKCHKGIDGKLDATTSNTNLPLHLKGPVSWDGLQMFA